MIFTKLGMEKCSVCEHGMDFHGPMGCEECSCSIGR